MDPARRKKLREAVVAALAPEPTGSVLDTFLPLRMHRDALADTVTVVIGERGAGKTAMFQFLKAIQDRGLAIEAVGLGPAARHAEWLTGFEEGGPDHPPTFGLARWSRGQNDEARELFWLGHLVGRLSGAESPFRFIERWRTAMAEPAAWVSLVDAESGTIYGWLDREDEKRIAADKPVVVLYDDLDRILVTGGLAEPARMSAALIALWLRLSRRYRSIRSKVFLRPDLFDAAGSSTTDASKLSGRTARLTWTREDVFRVLLRRLGARRDLRDWLKDIPFEEHKSLGYLPPYALPEAGTQLPLSLDPLPNVAYTTQEDVASSLAGRTMGTGVNKGLTHRWMLNHTADGRGQMLPRVTLNLVRNAARSALDRAGNESGEALLSPSDLEAAQGPTGKQRLEELRESDPVTWRLEHLRGRKVPISSIDEAAILLATPHLDHEDGFPTGTAALTRLMQLGTLVKKAPLPGEASGSERVDIPDLFRRSLEVRREGGPRQLPKGRP